MGIKKDLVTAGVSAAMLVALVAIKWLPLANAMGLVGVVCLAWFFRKEGLKRWLKTGLFLLLVPLVFWVATYRPAGFSYPLLFSLPTTGSEVPGHDFFINFAKALAGFLLLYLLWPKLRADEFIARVRYQFALALIAPALLVAVAIPALGLALQPKPVGLMLLFAAVNLLVICVAEEAFMRFLFQHNICNAIATVTANRWIQELVTLVLVTGIFVAIHAGLSGAAIWVYALAGFLYGLSYTLSKNICYPIMIHFFVNQIHFSFLTYPL